MPTFEWNDETITNSYGFRVRNSGNLARFEANPIMQNSHVNTTAMNLGSWKNWIVNGFKLLGDTVFDTAREIVAEVEGQVERGFIKACSMGIGLSLYDEDSWQLAPDGVWELVKWELMEVSICAIPSLSSALALYDSATGELIAEDQIKLSIKNLSANEIKKPNTPNMEKIILTPGAMSALLGLGITSADNVTEISRGIETLQTQLAAEKANGIKLQTKLDEQVKLQAEALVDGAIEEERVLKGEREEWLTFATANYSLAAKQIAKLKSKTSLTNQVEQQEGANSVKTADDFEKLSDEKKLAYKAGSPEAYKKLFAA